MSCPSELQDEEREVLSSIYDGDEAYKQITLDTHQYKYGVNNDSKSFVLEIKWGPQYPDEKPQFNMDTFYNKHIKQNLKDKICEILNTEAEQYIGMSMSYSLFEFIKEKFEDLMQEQPEEVVSISAIEENVNKIEISEPGSTSQSAVKKEHLTKAQKRRQWDKVDSKGEKPRGWNWVDLVKHLSQTGGGNQSKKDESTVVMT